MIVCGDNIGRRGRLTMLIIGEFVVLLVMRGPLRSGLANYCRSATAPQFCAIYRDLCRSLQNEFNEKQARPAVHYSFDIALCNTHYCYYEWLRS